MVFKKIIFQNSLMANETPSRPPPLHGKCHLKFPFWFSAPFPNMSYVGDFLPQMSCTYTFSAEHVQLYTFRAQNITHHNNTQKELSLMSQIIGNEKLIIAEMRKPWTFPFLKMELVNKARAILRPAEAQLDKWTSSGDKARWTGGQFPIFKKYSMSNLFQNFLYPVSPLKK